MRTESVPQMHETFESHRHRLFGIAYRMLGRVAEAEDAVQETWLRWQAQDTVRISSSRAWLTTAVTRLCIDRLRSAAHVREQYYGVWLPEPLVEETAPSPSESAMLADSLSMAFLLMLDTLSPAERAVFLLRAVFDHSYDEIASIVGKSPASCRQIVHRAKLQLKPAAQAGVTRTDPGRAEQVTRQFLRATSTGELRDLLSVLTDDATLYSDGGGLVRAAGRPIQSAERVSRFFIGVRRLQKPGTRSEFAWVNGRPGALVMAGTELVHALSLELAGDRVRRIYVVRNPEKLRHLAARRNGAIVAAG